MTEKIDHCFVCGRPTWGPPHESLIKWNCFGECGCTHTPDGKTSNWGGINVCDECCELLDERLKLKAQQLKLEAHELKKQASFVESLVGKLARTDTHPITLKAARYRAKVEALTDEEQRSGTILADIWNDA